MGTKTINQYADAKVFLRTTLGKRALAPLTGQDHRALCAFAATLQLYSAGDGMTRSFALVALRTLILCAQPSVRHLFKALVPWAMDWSDEEPVWALVMR